MDRRERNKLRTWEAIHTTAAGMVLKHGLAAVTVDAIADSAGVSRRTFFNYFATKEDAVLGTQPAVLTPADLDAFETSTDDLFGRVVRLMTTAVQSAFRDLPAFTERRPLLKAHPELLSRVDQHVREAESLVREQLARVAATTPGSDEDARALLLLAASVMRFAFAPRPDGSIDVSPETIDAAIVRFRRVIKEAL